MTGEKGRGRQPKPPILARMRLVRVVTIMDDTRLRPGLILTRTPTPLTTTGNPRAADHTSRNRKR